MFKKWFLNKKNFEIYNELIINCEIIVIKSYKKRLFILIFWLNYFCICRLVWEKIDIYFERKMGDGLNK